jgi:hypothetical protein
MNDRIQQLAKQAGIIGQSETAVAPPMELFVELIVKECVAAIEPGPFLQGTAHDNTRSIMALSQRKIKKHFGVEE